jgi:uncharacterized surface protein with fasciclin (FAS1) repeats
VKRNDNNPPTDPHQGPSRDGRFEDLLWAIEQELSDDVRVGGQAVVTQAIVQSLASPPAADGSSSPRQPEILQVGSPSMGQRSPASGASASISAASGTSRTPAAGDGVSRPSLVSRIGRVSKRMMPRRPAVGRWAGASAAGAALAMATITLYPTLSPQAVEATAPAPGTGGPVTDVVWHSGGFLVDTGPVDPYGSTVIYTLDPTVTDGTVTLSEIEVSGDAAITAVTAHHQSDPTMVDTLFLLDPVEVEELALRAGRDIVLDDPIDFAEATQLRVQFEVPTVNAGLVGLRPVIAQANIGELVVDVTDSETPFSARSLGTLRHDRVRTDETGGEWVDVGTDDGEVRPVVHGESRAGWIGKHGSVDAEPSQVFLAGDSGHILVRLRTEESRPATAQVRVLVDWPEAEGLYSYASVAILHGNDDLRSYVRPIAVTPLSWEVRPDAGRSATDYQTLLLGGGDPLPGAGWESADDPDRWDYSLTLDPALITTQSMWVSLPFTALESTLPTGEQAPLSVGDCVVWPDGPLRQTSIRAVPCDLHQGEVVHIHTELDGAGVPHDRLRDRASGACRARWQDYTGRTYFATDDAPASMYYDNQLLPRRDDYEGHGGTVVCVASRGDYRLIEGPVRDAEVEPTATPQPAEPAPTEPAPTAASTSNEAPAVAPATACDADEPRQPTAEQRTAVADLSAGDALDLLPFASRFTEGLAVSGLRDVVNTGQALTIIVPDNCAWTEAEAPPNAEFFEAMWADPAGLLTTVLGHHVITGRFDDSLDGTYESFIGEPLDVSGFVTPLRTRNADLYFATGFFYPPSLREN